MLYYINLMLIYYIVVCPKFQIRSPHINSFNKYFELLTLFESSKVGINKFHQNLNKEFRGFLLCVITSQKYQIMSEKHNILKRKMKYISQRYKIYRPYVKVYFSQKEYICVWLPKICNPHINGFDYKLYIQPPISVLTDIHEEVFVYLEDPLPLC